MTSTSSQLQSVGEQFVPDMLEATASKVNRLPQIGKRSIWSSIQIKATLAAIAIGTIPVMAIGATSYYLANESATKQIAQAKTNNAIELSDKVNRFLFERYGDIQILASLDIFTDAKIRAAKTTTEKQAVLDRFAKTYRVYDSIAVFDLNGDAIAQSQGTPLKNHKSRIYFQEPLKTDRPYISQPLISITEGTFNIYVSAPVKDAATGKTIAIIRSRMPVKFLGEVAEEFGKAGEEFHLIDSSGKFFLAQEKEQLGRNADADFLGLGPLIQQKQSGSLVAIDKIDGAEQLVGYAPTQKLADMPELNWGTVIAVDTAVAFASQRQLLITLGIGTGIAALLVGAIATYLVRRVTKPILTTTAAMQKVGLGELDTRVEVKGDDEIALLGDNLNQMAGRIKTLLAEAQESSNQIEMQSMMLKESEALQADVGHILDVVSAVEDGDLTVEADVSDRATGLVSDTLNRLIEELAKIMAVVLSTSRQIDRSANDLKQVAVAAAQQVELQTRSVNQAQTLMTNVNEISQNTAEQAIASDAAVQQAQVAVSQGQKEMQAMTKGIVALQAGTEQIVKRTQTLSEFVSSATQFTNDQKRVAALTRVLALNASMIAARASAQQDPEQFASVAREFETIANQVNELAVQTNQSLSLLQQRTDRIQTVVSGVDQDVQEITSLVDSFTLGVDRSRQVLDNIKAVTAQVAEVGQQVTQSSQAIATAAQTTLGTIYDIAAVANEAEQQSRITRDKAEGMDRLARTLLDKVQFFRLPSNLEPETEAKQLTASVGNGANVDDTVPDLSAVRSPIAIR
jgi:twitching motility protein PilJ